MPGLIPMSSLVSMSPHRDPDLGEIRRGCFLCCGREEEDPLNLNLEGCRRLLRHRLQALPPSSP